jgi:hypothetical protein
LHTRTGSKCRWASSALFDCGAVAFFDYASLRSECALLIRPFLEMADSQKTLAYTDTVTRSNVALYEHFGFQCVEESAVSGTGLTVWALRRPIR